jgi:hypothetical protein
MQTIKCTAKLRTEMGLKNTSLPEPNLEAGLLGAWHANLIYVNRKKCVLFVNDKTLYNFAVINLSRAKIKELDSVFLQHLVLHLFQEGFSEEQVKQLTQEYDRIQFAKTDSKSVLGSMNDLAWHYKYHLVEDGEDFLPHIVHELNRMPMGAMKYAYAIDVLRQVIEEN